eukprot:COSAG04_NODE_2258_length_4432_cov_1.870759_6_plen_78_part_00
MWAVWVCVWAHKKGDCLPSSRDMWEGSIGNAALCEPARKCLPGTQRSRGPEGYSKREMQRRGCTHVPPSPAPIHGGE